MEKQLVEKFGYVILKMIVVTIWIYYFIYRIM